MARVPNDRFVKVWQSAESAGAAAKKLGMNYLATTSRAYQLRARGVKLRFFRKGPPKVDAKALNKFCR